MQALIDLFTVTETVSVIELGTDLVLSALLSGLVYLAFLQFGDTISSRRQFGRIFFLVAVCTTLIIAVIKSSIALSLGLVGALSIVRFRAAIKEPEELAYLFLCVAIGLGFGAGLRIVTLFGSLVILVILVLRGLISPKRLNEAYNFNVSGKFSLGQVTEILRPSTRELRLRRSDSGPDKVSMMFAAEFRSLARMEAAIAELRALDPEAVVSFISNSALI
ncbi:MAG: DUF4956 domain-containing protein [Peptococcaceae bacterium]|jgi:hypothetical protein|nr:DUF4956 domain-containing protein [Peptococcaceae bacterium]